MPEDVKCALQDVCVTLVEACPDIVKVSIDLSMACDFMLIFLRPDVRFVGRNTSFHESRSRNVRGPFLPIAGDVAKLIQRALGH